LDEDGEVRVAVCTERGSVGRVDFADDRSLIQPGAPCYVGENGEVTTERPSWISMQVGTVQDPVAGTIVFNPMALHPDGEPIGAEPNPYRPAYRDFSRPVETDTEDFVERRPGRLIEGG